MEETAQRNRLDLLISMFPQYNPYCLKMEAEKYLGSQQEFDHYVSNVLMTREIEPVDRNDMLGRVKQEQTDLLRNNEQDTNNNQSDSILIDFSFDVNDNGNDVVQTETHANNVVQTEKCANNVVQTETHVNNLVQLETHSNNVMKTVPHVEEAQLIDFSDTFDAQPTASTPNFSNSAKTSRSKKSPRNNTMLENFEQHISQSTANKPSCSSTPSSYLVLNFMKEEKINESRREETKQSSKPLRVNLDNTTQLDRSTSVSSSSSTQPDNILSSYLKKLDTPVEPDNLSQYVLKGAIPKRLASSLRETNKDDTIKVKKNDFELKQSKQVKEGKENIDFDPVNYTQLEGAIRTVLQNKTKVTVNNTHHEISRENENLQTNSSGIQRLNKFLEEHADVSEYNFSLTADSNLSDNTDAPGPSSTRNVPNSFSNRHTANFDSDLSLMFPQFFNEQLTQITNEFEVKLANLQEMFPNSKSEYLRNKLEECLGDNGRLEQFIAEEAKKNVEQSDGEEDGLEAEYLKLLHELPNTDPTYLRAKWENMAGDQDKIKQFVHSEKKEIEFTEKLNELVIFLPNCDEVYLRQNLRELMGDEEGIRLFIEDELLKQKIKEQVDRMKLALPELDEMMLRLKCEQFEGDEDLVQDFINEKLIELEEERNRETQWYSLITIAPDADVEYLRGKFDECQGVEGQVNTFINSLLESKDYPKIKEVDPGQMEKMRLWQKYNDHFTVDEYLRHVPDPVGVYSAPTNTNPANEEIVLNFLTTRYPQSTENQLKSLYAKYNHNLTKTCQKQDQTLGAGYTPPMWAMPDTFTERLLQEVCFIQHRKDISRSIQDNNERRSEEIEVAKICNTLLSCECCFEEENLPDEIVQCPDGHIFCKTCVKKSVEISFGEGSTSFKCLSECQFEFPLTTIQLVVSDNVYTKIITKRQAADLEAAEVSGLEKCPHCDYVNVLSPDDKVFKCNNSNCLKETCRLCKEASHVPLRCAEVERPADVRVRTNIEEEMTNALVRKCYKCSKPYIKQDGCNKIQCSCGAAMCYICRQPVRDYNHFNGQGGTNYNRCSLYDVQDDIGRTGRAARDAQLQANPGVRLVHDPTEGF